jgi:DNA-binding NarL/FixJ family response regulator
MRALLVDDHTFARAGLRHVLEQDARFRIVSEAQTAAEALEAVTASAYHVVLLDSQLPDTDCIVLISALLGAAPTIRILLMVEDYDGALLVAALKKGAHGAVCKSDPVDTIVETAHKVAQGDWSMSPAACRSLLRQLHAGGLHDLAPRELEVLRLIALGKSNKEIATAMGKSFETVKMWRKRGMRKLGARTTAEFLSIAASKGWIDMGGRGQRNRA